MIFYKIFRRQTWKPRPSRQEAGRNPRQPGYTDCSKERKANNQPSEADTANACTLLAAVRKLRLQISTSFSLKLKLQIKKFNLSPSFIQQHNKQERWSKTQPVIHHTLTHTPRHAQKCGQAGAHTRGQTDWASLPGFIRTPAFQDSQRQTGLQVTVHDSFL